MAACDVLVVGGSRADGGVSLLKLASGGRHRELLLIHRGQRHGGLGRRLGSGRQPLYRSGPAPTPGGTIGGGDKQASRSFALRLRTLCTAAGPDPG